MASICRINHADNASFEELGIYAGPLRDVAGVTPGPGCLRGFESLETVRLKSLLRCYTARPKGHGQLVVSQLSPTVFMFS